MGEGHEEGDREEMEGGEVHFWNVIVCEGRSRLEEDRDDGWRRRGGGGGG